jgi:hypothetical protein
VVADAVGVENARLETDALFASGGIDAVVLQDVPADISLRLSFHSCNYGILIGWCPYNPWGPLFTSDVGVTLNVSMRRRCRRRNTLVSGRRSLQQ